MTDITQYLNDILTEENGEDVTSAIISCLRLLVEDRYISVDIADELSVMSTSVYGKSIKGAIYDSLVALSNEDPIGEPFAPVNNSRQTVIDSFIIQSEDYGRDIRLAIHDAILKLACYEKNIDYDETKISLVEANSIGSPVGDTLYFESFEDTSTYMTEHPTTKYHLHVGTECGMTRIGELKFSGASNLLSADITSAITDLGTGCFYESGLKYVKLSDSLTTIQERVFRDTDLLEIVFPDSVASIGEYVCYGCSSLKKAALSPNITEIPTSAFAECTSLVEVVIPNGIESIGVGAFIRSALTDVDIPASVTSISSGAFSNCDSLTRIVVRKAEDSISGAPWGATNATVTWTE